LAAHILVFGAGAVGSFLGGRLAQAGCRVTLVGRAAHVEAVVGGGLRVKAGNTVTAQAVGAVREVGQASGPYDFVLLTTKSYDTTAAVDAVAPVLRPGTILGTFQNGVGNEETIATALPDQALLSGTLTLAVSLKQPGLVIQHGRSGGVGLAPATPEVNVAPLVRICSEAGFAARRYTDFRAMKWSKLLLNLLANAQSAILDLPPAKIFADRELFRYERLAFREAVAVMDRLGIPVVALPGFAVPTVRRVMALPALLAQLVLLPQVGAARGDKMPGLWWDVEQGRGRTEARVLNGAVVDAGARAGVPTPVNSVLWAILEQIAAVAGERDRYRRQPARLKSLLRAAARL